MRSSTTRENTGESSTGFAVVLCLLSTLALAVNLCATFVFAIATDRCVGDLDWFLCSGVGAAVMPLLPWFGWGTAIAASIGVSSRSVRRGGSRWTGLPFGFAIYALVLLVGYSIATG